MTSEDKQLCERAARLYVLVRNYEEGVSPLRWEEVADVLFEMRFRIVDLSAYAEEEDSTNDPSRERLKLEEHLDLMEHVMERLDVPHHTASSILKEALGK